MAERKISLIMQWLESHPEQYEAVRNKLKNLGLQYMQLEQSLTPLIKKGIVQQGVSESVGESFAKESIETVSTRKNLLRLSSIFGDYNKKQDDSKKRVDEWSKKMQTAGWRVGWLSFRMVIIGKMLTRWMIQPIQKVIEALSNWDQSLETVAMTLGLLQSQGVLSGEMADFLYDTLVDLPQVGLEVQGALGALQSVLIGIGVDVGPVVADVLLQLAEAFAEVWTEVSPTLIPALEDLVEQVLPPLIDLIRETGPAILLGFVDGLKMSIPLFVGLLEILRPILPVIAKILGFILPFAPILLAIGTLMYFISPVLLAISLIIKVLGFSLPVFAAGLKAVGAGLGTMGTMGAAAVPVLVSVGFAAMALAAAVMAVVAAIAFLTGRWGSFTSGLANVIGALRGMCFRHAAASAEVFTDSLERTNKEIGTTVRDVNTLTTALKEPAGTLPKGAGGPAGIGPTGAVGTQYITIEAPITFEGISIYGVTDLEDFLNLVQDRTSKGIAEGAQRLR